MATSKGRGGAGRPRNEATNEALTLAIAASKGKPTDREGWQAGVVVKVTNPETGKVETLKLDTPLPKEFGMMVVVPKGAQSADKAAASLLESVSRLARMDGTRGRFATLSEGFTFDGERGKGAMDARAVFFVPKPIANPIAKPKPAARKPKR